MRDMDLECRTIPAVIERAARLYHGRTWLRANGMEVTFDAAARSISATSGQLRRLGVQRRDVVVVTARNEPRYLIVILSVIAAGGIIVPVNPASSGPELQGLLAQLRTAGPVGALVTDAGLRDAVGRAAAQAGVEAPLVDVNRLAILDPKARGDDTVDFGDQSREADVAVLMPTSGTTGQSKLVMQSHRAYVMAGEGFPFWLQLTAEDRLMTALPLFHTNALAYSTMGSLVCGGGLVLLPSFSASTFLDSARQHGATTFNAVGAMLEILRRQPIRADDDDNPLRNCYVAPSPPRDHQLEFEHRFGVEILCGYGLSESVYGMAWRPGTRPFGTLGWPRQHPSLGVINMARVVDEHGSDVPAGTAGELLLRNPTVTQGYYGMPQETAAVLRDGWLHTGDLVSANPDGTYTFIARKKEVIRRRGENVSPAEIEGVLGEHPAVTACAVVGVPSDLGEEEIKAYVQMAAASPPAVAELWHWVAQHLAAYKVPRYWHVIDEMPRTPTGRVAKHRLEAAARGPELDLIGSPNSASG